MTIERICTICHQRIKPGSKLKIYCQCAIWACKVVIEKVQEKDNGHGIL